MVAASPKAKVSHESQLVKAIHSALNQNPHLATRTLRIETGEGAVRLHGRVESFFEKQIAQEVVRRLDGVTRVENLLQVAWA